MFALIVFGMYCVTVFFIILSMFFAMVSAAQEAIEEANASTEDEKTPRVLKDLAHFFRGPCRVLGYVPIVGALVPDQRSLLKLANEESEDEDDEESKEEEEEEEEEEIPEDPFDDLKTDSEDFKRSVSDPSVVVLEALQDIGAAQKELADLLRVATARKRASMEVDRVRTASRGSRGSMSQPPSRAVSRGSLNLGGIDIPKRESLDDVPPRTPG